MENANINEYKDFRVGQVLSERIGETNKRRMILCKGIFIEKGKYYAGFQYIDRKATRANGGKPIVSGKSPFWFEKI